MEVTLHPEILAVCKAHYEAGLYADAVFAGAKKLTKMVQKKAGEKLDGAPLMRKVFSRDNPILRFNELKTESDRSEQEGMMHLFEGAALAIRNPRGHEFVVDSAERAVQYLATLSLLAEHLEETKRTRKSRVRMKP
jgi:uncharacterized protein (TIGR02391 family)